ncbi:flagellar hook protein FlgE [Methylopila henanensis]|uniref:Flagellar hook protein FlgE n=1 Tax=Methylopila henanensis TaxID=873516 RepID=A0ABW4KAR8_9HYPH
MNTAVSGLRAQSYALENISGNIANASTVGYKRTETSFADLVLGGDVSARRQTSGSVMSFSRSTNDLHGNLTGSTSATSLGINGPGYLLVQKATGSSDGSPIFGAGTNYTRRGDFDVDRNGYLYNGAGYYLMANRLDPATGSPVGSSPEMVQISKDPYPAVATSTITYRGNLPATPKTANYVAGDESSWLLDPTLGSEITADQSAAFIASSVSGDSLTVYDATGTAQDVQFRWGKVSNADDATGAGDTWALFYQSNSAATGSEVAWTQVDADPTAAGAQAYVFEGGALTTPAGGSTTVPSLVINGVDLGSVSINHGSALTQYADATGLVSTKQVSQNGSAAGDYVGVEVSDGGTITATYSNGKTRALYSIPLATFVAENQLKHLDGGAYAATAASGSAVLGSGSAIVGMAIEESNVDIADEFTKLIVTQQAYSANTRVVSTSDSMMQEALSMLR